MPLTPYTGPFGRSELGHLLRRSMFGSTMADLEHFNGQSLSTVVDALLDFENDTTPPIKAYWGLNGVTPDPSLVDPDVPFGTTWIDTPRSLDGQVAVQLSIERIQSLLWWRTGLCVEQERTLREKLTLFWFNHMPTQVEAIFNPRFSYDYDQLLRTHCKGNFRQMVHDVSVSGAMLIYLNGALNTAAAPDENFARELLELFTLGEGSGYTEADVQAAARVLTGWTVRETDALGDVVLPFVSFRASQHVSTDKQFSAFFNNTVITGESGPDAGELELVALLDMIFATETVSKFICRQLYRFFVHGDIDATTEADVIEPLAQLFREQVDAPDQMRIVLHAMFMSEHFFSTEVRACMIASPVDLVVGNIRKLDIPMPTPTQFEARYRVWRDVYFLVAYCGQELMEPPNVAGWPAYYQFPQYDDIWMDTATYPARNISMQAIIYNGFSTANDLYQPESRNLQFKVDLLALVAQFSDANDPNVLVAEAAELLYTVPISTNVQSQLKTNYLLFGQMNDVYWTDAYELYVADPNTTNMTAQLVPTILLFLFVKMCEAAEIQLH